MRTTPQRILTAAALAALLPLASLAGGITYATDEGDILEIGGRIQLQYHRVDPDAGETSDELRFRRLRPYISGSIHENWTGKIQWDMGKSDLFLKDAYLRYSGCPYGTVTIGNAGFPFSQEFLTSSKYQQLVERTFVGDHNYGTPDRQAGIYLAGHAPDRILTWAAGAAMGAIDPDTGKLDFDSTIQFDKGDDWSEGPMAGARIGWHPLGYLKPSQGDFDGEGRISFHAAGFAWENDDDNLDAARSNDVENVVGLELSAAVRGAGFSLDVQYNRFDSELVQRSLSTGLYEDGETELENYAVEGGYMVVPDRVELVAGYQTQDADGYEEEWTRTSFGINTFVHGHDVKCQLTYRMGENVDGIRDNDEDELFAQVQYVF